MTALLQAEAFAALNSGCAVTSPGTPSINSTYMIDPPSQQKILSTVVYVAITGQFPAGETSWTVKDINGISRVFPSTALFNSFAIGVANYVAQLSMLVDNIGSATSLPTQPVVLSL